MKYGKLFYDFELDRINIAFEDGGYGDGFHSGDILDVYDPQDGHWKERRLEYDHSRDEWYFAGFAVIPAGAEIRI